MFLKHLHYVLKRVSVKLYCLFAGLILLTGCGGTSYVRDADRNEIITIGDSIFDLSGDIQRFLEEDAGETFRDYTQSGAELAGGGFARAIVDQYTDAKGDNSFIQTVIMDGGGNDILIPAAFFDPFGCRTQWYRPTISSRCEDLVIEQYITAVDLLNDMQADGVQNVIWLGYYELPRRNANLTQALNFGNDSLKFACEVAGAVPCQFVDPRGLIPASDVLSDNVHPTESGSRKLADLIWPRLAPLL